MKNYSKYGKGWFRESDRHRLARLGIKTGRKSSFSRNLVNYQRNDDIMDIIKKSNYTIKIKKDTPYYTVYQGKKIKVSYNIYKNGTLIFETSDVSVYGSNKNDIKNFIRLESADNAIESVLGDVVYDEIYKKPIHNKLINAFIKKVNIIFVK